ncbi:MAG: glycosyltransferase family 4 protein [Dehalococcoidia bacterium]
MHADRLALPEERPEAFRIALVSTCPPRQCGIATFASDLAGAIEGADPAARVSWAAIDDTRDERARRYGDQVRWRIRQRDARSYAEVAAQINASPVDVVSIQHEFGLYGIWGETFEDHLAPFLDVLRKPLVTGFHTVLPNPSRSVRDAVRRIGRRSEALIVMAHRARNILELEYGIDPATVHVIPHGAPPVAVAGRERIRARLGLEGRSVISTFGLLDPRKGIEYMVRAMPQIVRRRPDALYLILGKTHPELVHRAGEAYRAGLIELVRACGVERHVAFIDEYLTQAEVVDYLVASDVYVTPYLDLNQITSGTLAYALAAGKAIVSTPYAHAVEVLADHRGLLVPARSEQGLADAVSRVLAEDELRSRLERNAYHFGRLTAWPHIGRQVLGVLRAAARNATSGPAEAPPRPSQALVEERHPALT